MAEQRRVVTAGFRWQIGRASLWLRESWILRVAMLIAAMFVGSAAWASATADACLKEPEAACVVDPQILATWPTLLWVAAAIAAVAAFLDFVAGAHDKKLQRVREQAQQSAAGRMLTALISLHDQTQQVAFSDGDVRKDRLIQARTALATAASLLPIAPDVRATYYPLTTDPHGHRELLTPVSYGRVDAATTVWREHDEPAHPIWSILSAADTDAEIARAPEPKFQVDWTTKPYQTFISVPVKANRVVFGMLSVNAPNADDFTELDRLGVILAARSMATVLALESPVSVLTAENR